MNVPPKADRLEPALLKLIGCLLLGSSAALLDTTAVSLALDDLGREFGSPVSTIHWVTTGYLLGMAMVLPLVGWTVDRFGERRMWIFTQAGFLAGSVLCGLAWSAESLILFRILQGVAGGMTLPLGQAILARAAGRHRLGRAMAVISIPAQLMPILGPVLGGVVLDSMDWRWIFYLNVPLCLASALSAWRTVPQRVRPDAEAIDLRGLILLSPAVALLIWGLTRLGQLTHEVSPPAIGASVAGTILLGGFVAHALRSHRSALIDLRLFAIRSFSVAAVSNFLFGISLYGPMFLLPLFYQQVREIDATTAGLLMAPQGLGSALVVAATGRLTDRVAPRPLALLGIAVSLAATVPFAWADQHTWSAVLMIAMFFRGAGMGLAALQTSTAGMRDLDPDAIPRATSAVVIVQRLGATGGVAVLAMILYDGLTTSEPVTAFNVSFWWTIAFTAPALVAAWFLPKFNSNNEEVHDVRNSAERVR